MGGGASTQEVAQLRQALDQKEAEIERLRNLAKTLEASKLAAESAAAKVLQEQSAAKSHEVLRATRPSIVGRPSLVGRPSQVKAGPSSIAHSGSTTSFHAKAQERKSVDPAKKRRVEVSAEVMREVAPQRFNKVVHTKPDMSKELILKAIQSNILFQGLSQGEQSDCVDAFQIFERDAGAEIITQGDQGEHFFVVQSGSLDILVSVKGNPAIKFGSLTSGMGFGELALLCNTPRAATIKSKTPVVLWALDRNDFREICTTHEAMRHAKAVEFLRQVEVLKKLSSAEIIRVAAAMQWEEYDAQTVLFREGEMGEHFYVITSGDVLVTKMNAETREDEFVRVMTSGSHFGEMALLKDEMRSATCTSTTRVQLLVLAREHFSAMLGSLQELMERPDAPASPKKNSLTDSIKMTSIKYKIDIPFQDLEVMQALGSGAFGRVKLARHAPTDQTFALKCLVKSHIVANNLKDHVVNEKKVMMMLDHPFILKLHHTYKDDLYVYFLLELALGGELFTYLRRRERFDEASARFYVASVVLAFEHMHLKAIAYRDLKPENLILDAKGFLKVVDFGLAKVVPERTWTLCGTPDYLAPEIILNRGHDKAVDYWALGVLIYELIAGTVPFFADDPMQVYSLVLTGNIKFPVHFSRTCIDLVQKLLTQNPVRRLGNLKHGVGDIINHRWFSGYDWDGLLNRKLTPPIVPQLKSNMDASNFERIVDELKDVVPCSWDPDF
ncbi:Aste57867_17376 [Aphanomyces stellatus]|uniref:cGMP-dependent protein kinase n=1 Tax=Aphanomyces stellatus TaxID=120398 RepID=A0A485L8H7_9STRA|nr:hypothetical protein As57867_017316 [Aphanomyces stellatus]VFT94132.1 Aste57867_17376 [Aphanomyces stellatus]